MIPRHINPLGDERVCSWSDPLPTIEPDPAVRVTGYCPWIRQGSVLVPSGSEGYQLKEYNSDAYIRTSSAAMLIYLRMSSETHPSVMFPVVRFDELEAYGRFHFDLYAVLGVSFDAPHSSNWSKADSVLFQLEINLADFGRYPIVNNSGPSEIRFPASIPLAVVSFSGSPVVATPVDLDNPQTLFLLLRERITISLPRTTNDFALGDVVHLPTNQRYMIYIKPRLIDMGHADVVGVFLTSPSSYVYLEPITRA